MEGRGDCEYGDTTCDCQNDAWVCWDPGDCPMTRPADGSDCSPVGMQCDYGQDNCDCENSGWDCPGGGTGGTGGRANDGGGGRGDGGGRDGGANDAGPG
jgi:hypothetical protein